MPDKDPVPTAGDIATRTDPRDVPNTSDAVKEELSKKREPFVEQVEDKAKEAGDPYFGEFAEDEDDDRANEGTRPPVHYGKD